MEVLVPMVGTFTVRLLPMRIPLSGQAIKSPGQTLFIIEAMKMMNEIEAEVSGVIREISWKTASL